MTVSGYRVLFKGSRSSVRLVACAADRLHELISCPRFSARLRMTAAALCAEIAARSRFSPFLSSCFRSSCCPRRYSHRAAIVIALRIRFRFALRSAIALAPLPPPTPKAPRIVPQEVDRTYHQQVRILKPLSRCISGGLESRCAAVVNSASLDYVSNARSFCRATRWRWWPALFTPNMSVSSQRVPAAFCICTI